MFGKSVACGVVLFVIASCDSSGPTAPGGVARINVFPSSLTVIAGELGELAAEAIDADGNVLTERALVWASGNPAVVEVTQDGMVVGISVGGPVEVRATSEGISGVAMVTVAAPPDHDFPVYISVRSRGFGIEEPQLIVELDEARAARIASGDGRYVFEGVELGTVHLELKEVPDHCSVYPGRDQLAEIIEFPEKGQIRGAEVAFKVTCFTETLPPPYGFTASSSWRWAGKPTPVYQYEVSTGRLVRELDPRGTPVAASGDGRRLYLQDGNVLSIVDPTATPGSQLVAQVETLGERFRGAALTPDESELWMNAGSGVVQILATASADWHRVLDLNDTYGPVVTADDLVFSRDGSVAFLSIRVEGAAAVLLVDTENLAIDGTIEGFTNSPNINPDVRLGMGPDDRLYAMDRNGHTKIYSIMVGEVERTVTLPHQKSPQVSHARHEAYHLPAIPGSQRIEIRHLPTIETTVAVIELPEPSGHMLLSPDGRLGYVGQNSHSALVDLEERRVLGKVWWLITGTGVIGGAPWGPDR